MSTLIASRPMLAVSADDHLDQLTYPLIASFKMDGIRCLMAAETSGRGRAVSRTLKPIPNHFIRNTMEARLHAGKDGELAVLDASGNIDFRASTSAVMSREGEPDFRYFVFDNFLVPGSFEERLERLFATAPLTWSPPDWLIVVEQRLVHSADEVRAMFADALAKGFEGLILRCPKAAYKHNRSTLKEQGMLKVKPWADDEGLIVGMIREYENTNEKVLDERGLSKRSSAKAGKVARDAISGFVLFNPKWPKTFEVGTGLTRDEKEEFFRIQDQLIGKAFCRFSYITVGGYDVPRSCSYQGLRHPEDMSECDALLALLDQPIEVVAA